MLSRRRSKAASRTTSWPSTVMVPRSGVSKVARIESSVVLPAPLGPRRPKIEPRSTASETPRSARVSRRRGQPERKVFSTSRASIASMPGDDTIRAMAGSDEWRCVAATVPPGQSATFRLERAGRAVNGFVVNHDGHYRAYVNRCPHVGTPLDLWPNEFFSEDGCTLICSTHGAIYEPTGGLCTAGPRVGDRLTALPLALQGEPLLVRLPAAGGSPAPARDEGAHR